MNYHRIGFLIVLIGTYLTFLHGAQEQESGPSTTVVQGLVVRTVQEDELPPTVQAGMRMGLRVPPHQPLQQAMEENKQITALKKEQAPSCSLSSAKKQQYEEALGKVTARIKTTKLGDWMKRHYLHRELSEMLRVLFHAKVQLAHFNQGEIFESVIPNVGPITFKMTAEGTIEGFSREQIALILYFKSLIEDFEKFIEETPSWMLCGSPLVTQKIRGIAQFIRQTTLHQPENREILDYCKVKFNESTNKYIATKIAPFSLALGKSFPLQYPTRSEKKSIEESGFVPLFKTLFTAPQELNECIANPKRSPSIFDCNPALEEYSLNKWYETFYAELSKATPLIDEPVIVTTPDGTQFALPPELNESLILQALPERGKQETRSIDEMVKYIQGDAPKKITKKKKRKPAQSAAASPQQEIQESEKQEEAGAQGASEATPPARIEATSSEPVAVRYTLSAQQWFDNPIEVLKRDGYLEKTPPADPEKLKRYKTFQIALSECGGKMERAQQMVIDNHRVPFEIDRYMFAFPSVPTQSKYNQDCRSITALLLRTLKERTQTGVYNILYSCSPNSSKHLAERPKVYHRLFTPLNNKQVAYYLFEGQNPPEILSDLSAAQPNTEKPENDWEPAQGQWLIDASGHWLTFTNKDTHETYSLMGHPLTKQHLEDDLNKAAGAH